MQAFLANLSLILPLIGLEILKPRPQANVLPNEVRFEVRHKSVVMATAVEEGGEFVVLAGSRGLKDAGYQTQSYGELKRELVEQRVLGKTADGAAYEFKVPYAFKSPSAAAAVVLDRNANGRTEWKIVGSKRTYHDWQEDKARNEETAA